MMIDRARGDFEDLADIGIGFTARRPEQTLDLLVTQLRQADGGAADPDHGVMVIHRHQMQRVIGRRADVPVFAGDCDAGRIVPRQHDRDGQAVADAEFTGLGEYPLIAGIKMFQVLPQAGPVGVKNGLENDVLLEILPFFIMGDPVLGEGEQQEGVVRRMIEVDGGQAAMFVEP